MLRRRFFRWISAGVLPLFFPRFSRALPPGVTARETPLLLEIAAVVLPSSLGRTRCDEIARQFAAWTQNYKPGADAGYGYGFPRPQVLPANPADRYPDQLRQLEEIAASKGSSFQSLDRARKREILIETLETANIDKIPQRPNGKHIVADLLSFFYNSADGQDFLYNAAIKRDDCRGLATSAHRPAPLS